MATIPDREIEFSPKRRTGGLPELRSAAQDLVRSIYQNLARHQGQFAQLLEGQLARPFEHISDLFLASTCPSPRPRPTPDQRELLDGPRPTLDAWPGPLKQQLELLLTPVRVDFAREVWPRPTADFCKIRNRDHACC